MADARDLPLGKDADYFTSFDRVGGFAQRLEHFARAQFGGNRNRPDYLCERLHIRQIVDALEHQEADGTVRRSNQQAGIHERHVIRNKKRATSFRNIFAPLHTDAIDRVRRGPQHKPHQRIGQQVDRVRGGDQRKDRAIEENGRAAIGEARSRTGNTRPTKSRCRSTKSDSPRRSRRLSVPDGADAESAR